MSPLFRTIAVSVVVTALAAAAGGWAGIHYALSRSQQHSGLDELVHRDLQLDADQTRRIEAIEAAFATRRQALEDEMRAANHDLANAIKTQPTYGPKAQVAIERFHAAESALQEETVQHVLSMRAVLNPEQAKKFDEEISRALTSE